MHGFGRDLVARGRGVLELLIFSNRRGVESPWGSVHLGFEVGRRGDRYGGENRGPVWNLTGRGDRTWGVRTVIPAG